MTLKVRERESVNSAIKLTHFGKLHLKSFGLIAPFHAISRATWTLSTGHPHTQCAFTQTLVNVGDLRRNSGEWEGD